MKENKLKYASPQLEVIELENEMPVMVGSGTSSVTGPTLGEGVHFGKSSARYSSSSEFEDMITNILTFEE